jgi:hypothetical protein
MDPGSKSTLLAGLMLLAETGAIDPVLGEHGRLLQSSLN